MLRHLVFLFGVSILAGCSATPAPAPKGNANPQPAKQPFAEKHRRSPNEDVLYAGMKVRLTNAYIGKIELDPGFGRPRYFTDDDHLVIEFQLSNTTEAKKVSFRSWTDQTFAHFDGYWADLKDNIANSYHRRTFPLAGVPTKASSGSLYPGKSVTDLIVFEVPIAKAAHLDLDLPAKNFDCEGMLHFRIPIEFIKKADAPKDK